MTRKLLFILCVLALSLRAQDLTGKAEDSPIAPPENNLSIGLEKATGGGYSQPVNITSNMVGQLSGEKGSDVAGPRAAVQGKFFLSTGVEYADEGEYEQAEQAYRRALEMEPDSEETLFRLGNLYVAMERYRDAVDTFSKLLEIHPDSPLSHNNLAWCYTVGPDVRNLTRALRHAREALLFAPKSPSIWNTLAEAYYRAGDYPKALRSVDQSLLLLNRQKTPPEETVRSYQQQRIKILRAEQAFKMLEGLDED